MGGNMVELIFLLPTIICAIIVGVIAWHRRKQKTKADHEWANRILQ
jgi:cell division protein FtsL